MSKKVEPDFSQEPGPALHSARWRFGAYELDETRRELLRSGELLAIEPKPLNMLMLLLRHPGELVTKTELLDALWTGRMVNEAVVGNCVSSVRDVLGDDGAQWLKTVHGFGYRFDAPVQLIEDENKAPTIAAPKLDFQAGDQPPMRPNWRLVRRLGQTGDTWLAEHIKLRERRVFKFTIEANGLSALKREVTIHRLLRQSLPGKDHYVDVLDWNFDEPPYFIETEYCNGGSLLEWFDTQGGAAKVPIETRIELIARIADALADVHIVGVLHKDLKPANVFVVPDDGGIPKIRLADFGASRLLDPNLLAKLEITRHGFTQMIDADTDINAGTLLYLAPEVASGHPATVKSDIYALGVMLYQFVVGSLRRQLGAGWEVEIDDEMLREDIAAAAENNAERRIANAAELARRLRARRDRQKARQDALDAAATAELAARTLERAKARRFGISLAVAALAIGFVSSTVLYVQAREARDTARSETERAEAVSDFLGKDMFKAVSTDEHPVRDLTVKQLLDTARGEVERRFDRQPDIAAKVYEALGRSYKALEFLPESADCLDRALTLVRANPRSAPEVAPRLAVDLIELSYPLGRLPESIKNYESIHADAIRSLGPQHPASRELAVALARGRIRLGQWEQGAAELTAVLDGIGTQAEAASSSLVRTIQKALALVHLDMERYRDAEVLLDDILATELRERGPDHIEIAKAKLRLARVYTETERLRAAEESLVAAEKIARAWNRDDGGVILNIDLNRAWLRLRQQRADDAIAILSDIKKRVAGADASGFDQSYTEDRPLALAYLQKGDTAKGLALLDGARATSERHLGSDHPITLQIAQELGAIKQPVRLLADK